ncbi:MAG: hypothetical protein Q8P30_00565, partial [Candidatus Uhrbacteria bacterium]|nr:hypothetical protein [Candidatus Uhrbacteria bacterium]
EELKEKLILMQSFGKDKHHLFRLLSAKRSHTEQDFARAYIENFDDARVDIEDENALERAFNAQNEHEDKSDFAEMRYNMGQVIGQESADTKMWWTYAPYLFEGLCNDGVDPKEAVRRLFEWTKEAAKDSLYMDEPNTLHLPGLEEFNQQKMFQNTYILGQDPKGSSHQFTRQKAREIIKAGLI